MPLFHFNLADHHRDPDVEGTELSSVAEARVQAIVFAGSYLSDNPGLIEDGKEFRVEVTDDDGVLLFVVRMDVVNPEDDSRR